MCTIIKFAFKDIFRRKRRSAGITISFALIGCIVTLLYALNSITKTSVTATLWDIGAHSVAYIPRLSTEGCCVQVYVSERYNPEREGFIVNNINTNLISPDLVERIRQSPNVADAAPYISFRIRSSLGIGEWLIGGIDLSRPVAYSATVVAQSQVTHGRFISTDQSGGVMLEKEFAEINGFAVGSEIILGEIAYKVEAIVNPPLRPGKANIYMALPDLRKLIATRLDKQVYNPVNAVLIESKGADYHEQAQVDIQKILGQNSRISSFGCNLPGSNVMGISNRMALILMVTLLLFMFLSAFRIQYSSVVFKQYDLAILKSIGWRDQDITWQIITESVIYSLSGGILGVAIATVAFVRLAPEITGSETAMPGFSAFVLGLLVPLAGGILSGLLASGKVESVNPAEVLRRL